MTDKNWHLTLSTAELSTLLEYGTSSEREWSIELVRQALDIPHAAAETMAAGVASLQEKGLISLTSLGTLDEEESMISWFLPYLWNLQDALSFVMIAEGRRMTGVALQSKDKNKKEPAYIFAAGGGMFSSVAAVDPITRRLFSNYGHLAGSVYEQFISLLDTPDKGVAMAMTYHSPSSIALVNAHYSQEQGWDVSTSKPGSSLSPEMIPADVDSMEELGKVVRNGPFKALSLA